MRHSEAVIAQRPRVRSSWISHSGQLDSSEAIDQIDAPAFGSHWCIMAEVSALFPHPARIQQLLAIELDS